MSDMEDIMLVLKVFVVGCGISFFFIWVMNSIEALSDEDDRAYMLTQWVAGYLAIKHGPKNGVPIGVGGESEEYKAGMRDAMETHEFVEGFGGKDG